MFLCVDILNGTILTEGRKVFRLIFNQWGGFDLLLGAAIFY